MNVLSAVMRAAVRDRCTLSNPVDGVPRPAIPFRERPWIAPSDLQRLFRLLDPRWLPLYALLAGTGLRFGEAAALRWSDLDLERRRLVVTRRLARDGTADAPKSARSRRAVPIPAAVVLLLRQHYLRSPWKAPDDLVFTNSRGNPISDTNLRKRVLTPALRAAGLPTGGHHQFRHAYVAASLSSGVPIAIVSKIVGHSSLSMTADRYGHLVSDAVDEVGDRMNEMLFGEGASARRS